MPPRPLPNRREQVSHTPHNRDQELAFRAVEPRAVERSGSRPVRPPSVRPASCRTCRTASAPPRGRLAPRPGHHGHVDVVLGLPHRLPRESRVILAHSRSLSWQRRAELAFRCSVPYAGLLFLLMCRNLAACCGYVACRQRVDVVSLGAWQRRQGTRTHADGVASERERSRSLAHLCLCRDFFAGEASGIGACHLASSEPCAASLRAHERR